MNRRWIKAGFVINLLVSTLVLFLVFGSVIRNANSVYFSKSGDGLKSTYGSLYHVQYDSEHLHTQSMNYPYGESVFFTGNQPLLTNGIRLLKNTPFDISAYTLGILNCFLLFSFVLGAMFLYLLFRKLNLPVLYAILCANLIVFLSPQMDRLGGHFDLGYVYFIPMFLYFSFLYFEKPKLIHVFFLSLTAFLALYTQAYFFAFYGILMLFLFFGKLFTQHGRHVLKYSIFLVIQLALPLFVFQAISATDVPIDRTLYPWGFFYYKACPESVFLPIGKPYGQFLHFPWVKWEGTAYVGLLSFVVFLLIVVQFFRRLFNWKLRKQLFEFTDSPFLNTLLWAALAALLFSFTLPFSLGLEKLWNYAGPLRQLRGAGRFAWLFFYGINVVSVYLLWHYYMKKKMLGAFILLLLGLSVLSYDMYLNVRGRGAWLNNTLPEFEDAYFQHPDNKLLKEINTAAFQSILSLPIIQIGSENYWINGDSKVLKPAFNASLKTGLPLHLTMMSRTSIRQSLNQLSLFYEPLKENPLLKDLPVDKPILLLWMKGETLSANEERLRSRSVLLTENDHIAYYKLELDSIKSLYQLPSKEKIWKDSLVLCDLRQSDSLLVFKGFGNALPEIPGSNASVFKNDIRKYQRIFQSDFGKMKEGKYVLSFWMKDMDKDLIPRTNMIVTRLDSTGSVYHERYTDVWREVKQVQNNGWALIEFPVEIKNHKDKLHLTLINKLLTKGNLHVDEVLLRPENSHVYFENEAFVFYNNRFFIK